MAEPKRKRREPIVLSQMSPKNLLFVLCGCILFTFALINLSSVAAYIRKILSALGPVITGFFIAYVLAPAANWLEKRLCRLRKRPPDEPAQKHKFIRAFSSFFTVLICFGTLTLLVAAVSSQVADGIATFLDKLPDYIQSIIEGAEDLMKRDSSMSRLLRDLGERFATTELGMGHVDTVELSRRVLSTLASGAADTLAVLYDVIIGFVVAVYVLISRERFLRQFKQVLYAAVRTKIADEVDRKVKSASDTFGTAVIGKFVDSVIIGMLCFIGMTLLRMPYSTLIAVVIGVTNMIPFFGPIIGAIPCVVLICMEDPIKALYFLIFIVILQQFDANILDPRIVGKSIGLPAFWELFACMLGGGLFGMIGLVVGVPAFAVLYELIREVVGVRLMRRVKTGEMTKEFVQSKLGVHGEYPDLYEDEDEADSQYVQHLVMLEEIAQPPARRQEREDEPGQ